MKNLLLTLSILCVFGTIVSCGGDDAPDASECTLTVTTTSTAATTNGGADGTATATAAGGQGSLSYSWNTTPTQTTAMATGLLAGTYTVTVTDNITSGCTATSTVTISDPATPSNDISILASKFYASATTTVDIGDDFVTITTTDEPDHKSMYYPTNNPLYEDYEDTSNPDFKKNPNEISAQNYVFKIPRFPVEASNKTATEGDAFGVAINGVVFFNQVAAPGDDILEELNTFDQYTGHPQNQGIYHYHIEPTWLTGTISNEAFMGLLLDGFPVYGPEENGTRLTNDDLDEYHGHTSVTADFPNGIYHYHITDDLPWINGGEFYGTPGTKTN